MRYLNVGLGIVAAASLVALGVQLHEHLLAYALMLMPLLLILFLSTKVREYERRHFIQEIEAAGGYDAWRQKHGPVRR
jgi:hypothetical protein